MTPEDAYWSAWKHFAEHDQFWWSDELRVYLLLLKQWGPADVQIMHHKDMARCYVGYINKHRIAEGNMQEVVEALVAYMSLTDDKFRGKFNEYRERLRESQTKRTNPAASLKRN